MRAARVGRAALPVEQVRFVPRLDASPPANRRIRAAQAGVSAPSRSISRRLCTAPPVASTSTFSRVSGVSARPRRQCHAASRRGCTESEATGMPAAYSSFERHPRAVIEAARRIDRAGQPRVLEQGRRAARDGRRARRRIGNAIERLGKAVEIVDRLGPIGGARDRGFGIPVGRAAQHGIGPRRRSGESLPRTARRRRHRAPAWASHAKETAAAAWSWRAAPRIERDYENAIDPASVHVNDLEA